MKFLVTTRRRPHATLEVVLPKYKDELLEIHTMNASGFALDTYVHEDNLGAALLIEAPDLATVQQWFNGLPCAVEGWMDTEITPLKDMEDSALFEHKTA
ncbi:MAG: hypothetical protein ACRCYY_19175 [Trueperaceae bacterium]